MSPTITPAPNLAALRADVSSAARIIAPIWPLTSFVAVNPLGGFEHLPFHDACAEASARFGARTHRSLQSSRAALSRGDVTEDDLRAAIVEVDPFLAQEPPITISGRATDPLDVVVHDLVAGPIAPATDGGAGLDPHQRAAAVYVAQWCIAYVDESAAAFPMPERERGLFAAWHQICSDDRRLRSLTGGPAQDWIAGLPDDPASALLAALWVLDPEEHNRTEVLRSLATRLPGWTGYARWSDEWALDNHRGPKLRVLDVIALLAVIEASFGLPLAVSVTPPAAADTLQRRVAAVIDHFGGASSADDATATQGVNRLLERVPEPTRAAIWLIAHERGFRNGLLTQLADADPAPASTSPVAHFVACIDVRSEVLRRHLETQGDYDTYGFAGFFGVPISWRPMGSDTIEARCPVLVNPRFEVTETPIDGGTAPEIARGRLVHAGHDAYHDAKAGLGSPFALAESAGWLLGPLAALKTLLPGRWTRRREGTPTFASVDPRVNPASGLPLEDRTLFAEAILTTIGLTPTAPLLVLCGHGARTVNNPHASSLDCGACGGAPGGANARVAAAILNDPEVRNGLADRGIHLSPDTWVVAAEHETTSDVVSILDPHLVPAAFAEPLAALERDLATASAAASTERAHRLPGDPRRVRERGADWAQVRPEWGLAGNAAFIAAPRSVTAGVDLGSRSFLHSYDATTDPDGVALETILTAPLVVAQWISCQYYFSTVDPEVFGAGDKMLHNPIGGIGVVLGEGGDLAVGLPSQSVSFGDRMVHEPLRLLALVQAPLEMIDAIVARNPGLRDLVENEWIHIAARNDAEEPWALRGPAGRWTVWQPSDAHDAGPSTHTTNGPTNNGMSA